MAVEGCHCICTTFLPAGAIDVEELQYALEVMGIQKTNAEIQELMDSVDKDGSGEAWLFCWGAVALQQRVG